MPRDDLKVIKHYEKPAFSTKRRKCKVCGKVLSRYNLDEYCFAHVSNGAKLRRIQEEDRARKAAKKLKEKRDNDNKRRHRNNGA